MDMYPQYDRKRYEKLNEMIDAAETKPIHEAVEE